MFDSTAIITTAASIFFGAQPVAATTATPGTPPDCLDQLDHAEFIGSDTEVQMVAYDHAGEVIGTIAIWVEPEGQIHLASDYGDGYAETVVADGRARTDATLSSEVVATRADAMLAVADFAGPEIQEGAGHWFWCGSTAVIAVGTCVAGATFVSPLVACPGAAAVATCKCITAWAVTKGKKKCAE